MDKQRNAFISRGNRDRGAVSPTELERSWSLAFNSQGSRRRCYCCTLNAAAYKGAVGETVLENLGSTLGFTDGITTYINESQDSLCKNHNSRHRYPKHQLIINQTHPSRALHTLFMYSPE